jgi:hypothetical protein
MNAVLAGTLHCKKFLKNRKNVLKLWMLGGLKAESTCHLCFCIEETEPEVSESLPRNECLSPTGHETLKQALNSC